MTEQSERYWEARWRDEKAHNDALVKALTDLLDDKQTTYAVRVLRARAALASVGGVQRD